MTEFSTETIEDNQMMSLSDERKITDIPEFCMQ